jgi:hypothetical protein
MKRENFFLTLFYLTTILLFDAECLSQAQNSADHKPGGMGTYVVQLRDSATGYAVPGIVRLAPMQTDPCSAQFTEYRTDSNGKLSLNLPEGYFLIVETAPGYQEMRGRIGVAAGRVMTEETELGPKPQPTELLSAPADERLLEKDRDRSIIHGFVIDSETYKPLVGARVALAKSSVSTKTNQRGYFRLVIPIPPDKRERTETGVPYRGTLVTSLSGYRQDVFEEIDIVPHVMKYSIELNPGSGTDRHKVQHGPYGSGLGRKDKPTDTAEPSPLPRKYLAWTSTVDGCPSKSH